MSIHKRSLRVGVLVAILCALLIAWRTESRSRHASIAQADADNWTTPAAARQGVRLLETRDPSGPPAYAYERGDLLFFTNSGVSYGALNTRNSVVVINARTKQSIAFSDLDPKYSEKMVSHGIAVSPDGRYVYLPALSSAPDVTPSTILVLDSQTLKIYQVLASGGRPHHIKEFQDRNGRQWILVEDFNWPNKQVGKGFYILDPFDNNKVATGMLTEDIRQAPYDGFTSPDGKYVYFSMPAPYSRELREEVRGWLAKIDLATMAVVQALPMEHYPIWTVFTKDGKWAWTTQSEDGTVLKIQRAIAPGERDKVVAEVKAGPGGYGLRMSYDDKELWVADKGETLPGQRGTTLTIIDAEKNEVKRTLQTNCITNDHIIMSPDGTEMWATCNQSHEIVVLDSKTYNIKARIPMPNNGDSHGGVFVSYNRSSRDPLYQGWQVGEVVSDQNGLQGSAWDAQREGRPWVPPAAGSR
ncbi:MAG: YncE family protein [Acidobacteria bacterium]|nr:YncE family protein [Acidobacteriota bacterium]